MSTMITKKLLKILFVEDVPSDVDLAVITLKKEKLEFEHTIVCTRNDLLNALEKFSPDLIISDYQMPAFNGLEALRVAKDFDPDLPFILYTGSVNEETAVECLKAGAQDYVIKEHMARLPFAVMEALDQVRINREKRASELLLRDNEAKLHSIFSAAAVGIGLIVDNIFIEVNDTFCTMIGFSRSMIIGHKLESFLEAADGKISDKVLFDSMNKYGTGSVETGLKCKDSKIITVQINSTPLDKSDLSKGITLIFTDITERKRSEEELKASQNLFQTLSESSPVGIFRTRPDGYTTYVNPEWLKLSGLTFEEALGYGWLKAVHPDDRKNIENGWQDDINGSKSSIAEYRFLRADNKTVWVLGNAVPESINGKLEGYVGTITNITDRKNSEIALRKSEEKYRRIFENVQDVYYETSLDGIILEVSPSIFGLSRGEYQMDELIGRSMYDFYSESLAREKITSELRSRGYVSDAEVSLRNRDGSIMPCSISAKLIADSAGKPDKIIGSLRDITDRKNASDALQLAKEKAEASDKLKTDFLNNISHEVRTPLNGILGFAEIISLHDLSEQERKESLALLFESSNRLLNTITNYMDISLITSGSLTVNKKQFSPDSLLKKLFSSYEGQCSNKNLVLGLTIPEEKRDMLLDSDPEICQKILSHFIDNALKFTEHGRIDYGYRVKDSFIEFYVSDTGIGISSESHKRIFDRFSKENIRSYKISEGSGLGLAIAQGMADALGGYITLESLPDKGSVFSLIIPITQTEEMDTVNQAHDEKMSSVNSPILVAEDDETNFYYLNAMLKRETGARIIHASNGKEAVDIFSQNRDIKLILMDMKMPEMDGFEATELIKRIDPLVHIIAVTAYAMTGDEDRIREAGCDDYLSKPINKKILLEKIGNFI